MSTVSCGRVTVHTETSQGHAHTSPLCVVLSVPGEEPDAEDRAGDPKAQPDAERPESPEPAAQLSADLREAAQAGGEPPARHQAQPGEAEPRAAQVSAHLVSTLRSYRDTSRLIDCFCFSDCRERQDTDGQMKELQDQLEAEQYFSVSVFVYTCACVRRARGLQSAISAPFCSSRYCKWLCVLNS